MKAVGGSCTIFVDVFLCYDYTENKYKGFNKFKVFKRLSLSNEQICVLFILFKLIKPFILFLSPLQRINQMPQIFFKKIVDNAERVFIWRSIKIQGAPQKMAG